MTMEVKQKFEKIIETVEETRNFIYSGNLGSLTEMVKALYKEFQELLGPEEIPLSSFSVYNDQTRPSKWNKDGMKLTNGKTISVEEYIEIILKPENDLNKYTFLQLFVKQIQKLENTYHKELTGKYSKEREKQESSNAEGTDG